MNKTKYVVGLARAGYMEKVVAIIFPEDVIHEDMGMMFFGSKNRIIGAGFCALEEREGFATKMVPYGESVSLGIKARPDDQYYLDATLLLIDRVPAAIEYRDLEAIHEKIRAANANIGFIAQEVGTLPKAANE